MSLKILILLGAVAPVVLAAQHAGAAERASGFVVAQQQTDSGKSDKDNKKDKNKKKDERKDGSDKKAQQQTTQPPPAVKQQQPAVKASDDSKRKKDQKDEDKKKDDKADRKQDRDKGGQPAATQQPSATQQQQPSATQQQPSTAQQPADKRGREAGKYKRLEDLRSQRKESREGNRIVIREQNRTIIREGGRAFIRHDDSDRFRRGARSVQEERRGGNRITVIVRPDGTRITTVWGDDGRILRRTRLVPGGREFVLYENRGPYRSFDFVVRLGPFALHIPRDRYIVDAERADRVLLYDTLIAGPLEPIAHPYTLDEVRYSYDLRERMRRVDLDTINFETGSWDVTPYEARRLEPIAEAMRRAIRRNPDEVFLIEGHTDAVGTWDDNLLLSDHRAEAVAEILTEDFGIPPENLVTQGYGEQYLKVPTQGPDRRNRHVTIRRITPLLRGHV